MKSRAAFCSIPEASGTSSRRSKRTSCGVGFSCLESAAPLAQECVVRALALLTGDAPGVPRKFARVLGRTASRPRRNRTTGRRDLPLRTGTWKRTHVHLRAAGLVRGVREPPSIRGKDPARTLCDAAHQPFRRAGLPSRCVFFHRHDRDGERIRFLPDGKGLVYMQGKGSSADFWLLDLATMKSRPLTRLDNTAAMRTFDITPDGTQIVFDRLRKNSDIVLIDLF